MRERMTCYINRYTKISNVRYSLQHLINKASSTTLFSFKDAFRSVSLSAKKLKRFINNSEGKENEKNADVSG